MIGKFMRFGLTLLALSPQISSAATAIISLKDHYPQKYVVQKNDTLYSIAEKYLSKPWEWRKLWRNNPQLSNPNKLYPGMVLELRYVEGYPRLVVTRFGTYKLSPQSRARPAEKAIPPIHLSDIRPFLNNSRVLDTDELSEAGYVIAYKGEHLRGGQDVQIYVKSLADNGKDSSNYAIYRPDGIYSNPKHPKLCLGYKATYIGDAQLIKPGDPATLELTQITQGVQIKDRVLIKNKPDFDMYFEPKAPNVKIRGEIIDVIGGLDQVAQDQIVVLDKGKLDHLHNGDVVAIQLHERIIQDPLHKDDMITLPTEHIGEAMIFRTFTRTSYALIMRSSRSIKAGDSFSNP